MRSNAGLWVGIVLVGMVAIMLSQIALVLPS